MTSTTLNVGRLAMATLLFQRTLDGYVVGSGAADCLYDDKPMVGHDIQFFDSDVSDSNESNNIDDDEEDDPPMVAAVNDFSSSTETTSFSLSLSSSSSSSSSSSAVSLEPSFAPFDCVFPPLTIHVLRDYIHPSDLDDEDEDELGDAQENEKSWMTPMNDDAIHIAAAISNPYAQLLFDATHKTLVTAMEVCLADGLVRRLTRGIPIVLPEMISTSTSELSSEESSIACSQLYYTESQVYLDLQEADCHDKTVRSSIELEHQDYDEDLQHHHQPAHQYDFSSYWTGSDYDLDFYYDEENDTLLYLLHDLDDPWVSRTTCARRSCCLLRSGYCRVGAPRCGDALKKVLSGASSCMTTHSSSTASLRDRKVSTAQRSSGYHQSSLFLNHLGYQVLPN